jgi:hypothetical protein
MTLTAQQVAQHQRDGDVWPLRGWQRELGATVPQPAQGQRCAMTGHDAKLA